MNTTELETQRAPWRWRIAAALLLPLSAWAQFAVTTQAVNVRAGPDRGFPLVTWLPAGTAVNVWGCIQGWRWCDVGTGFNRGWVYARFLSMTHRNQPTVIINGGPWLGVPIVSFSVGSYWGLHYQNRPWWDQRNDWARQPHPPMWGPPPMGPPGMRPPSRPPVWQPPPPPRPSPLPPTSRPRPPPDGPPNFGPPPAGQPPPGARPPFGGSPPPSGGPSGRPPGSGGRPPGG
jgi:uncharacterized protein YraI